MSQADDQPRKDLADLLRDLRRASGLSGDRLAKRCALSQTKISRIETYRLLPTVDEVERILTALGVPAGPAEEIIALARQANVDYQSFRSHAQRGLWRMQDELKALADSSRAVRNFLPGIPTGLLHTEEYARAVLQRTVPSMAATDVEKAIRARMNRQQTLQDQERKFFFLLTEQAVRWKYASPGVMAELCMHMATMAQLDNIELGVVPHHVGAPAAPLHEFTVYDDRLVELEMMSGWVSLRDPLDIKFYLDMFAKFRESALLGDDAVDFLGSAAEDFMRMGD